MAVKSPIEIKDPTLRMTILVGGAALEDYFPVQSVEIVQEVNKISSAEITIVYEETDGGGFDVDKNKKLEPEKDIEIKAAYGSDTEVSIFKGVIKKQKLQVKSASAYSVLVTCKHTAIAMTTNTDEKNFYNKKDSDIYKKLVQDNAGSLSVTADATTAVMDALPKQKGTSDWDFMLARAEFNGHIVTLDSDKVKIGKPDLSASPVLRVAFGESIMTFNAEINTESQRKAVMAYAWDVKSLQELEVKSAEPTLVGPLKKAINDYKSKQLEEFVLKSNTQLSKEELQTWADGKLLRMRLSAFKGQVSFIGNTDVKPGAMLQLDSVGKNYDGNVFVSSVTHSITGGNWTTTVKFGLDDKSITEKSDYSPPPAARQVPPVHGLQVATVKKVVDKDSAYRVLITLPSKAADQEGTWARMSNLHATGNAGAVFYPEVGDEVVVGFFESDPRFPVILGSLYSKTKAPADTVKDDNNYIKSLTTKSKLSVKFDDEKKVLTISTPAGNSITLSDDDKSITIKDQNNNNIKLSSSGIELKTDKDITLKATGNINLNATGKVSVTASQDVELSGVNIKNTAKMGFTAKGNATAELSASGQTTVKGGMVMIN